MAAYEHIMERLNSRAKLHSRPHARNTAKLEAMRFLLSRLGNPESEARIVHVAGTNGKGLTSAMIAALLQDSGAEVGLYTSPHLTDIRDRFQIGSSRITREDFAHCAERVLNAAEREAMGNRISYFDILTAIAFVAFRKAGLDWWVVETGLGGMGDSTNVTPKRLAVLTRIGRDHEEVLGKGLRRIAEQKMGIARRGIPTVLARQDPDLQQWMTDRLRKMDSPVLAAQELFYRPAPEPGGVAVSLECGLSVQLQMDAGRLTAPFFACAENALAAGDALLGAPAGLEGWGRRVGRVLGTTLPGRLQLARRVAMAAAPSRVWETAVFDGGHNPDALTALAQQVERWGITDYTLIVGVLEDKMGARFDEPLSRLLRGSRMAIGLELPFSRAVRGPAMEAHLGGLCAAWPRKPEIRQGPPAQALYMASTERPLIVAGSLWAMGEIWPLLRFPKTEGVEVMPAAEKGAA